MPRGRKASHANISWLPPRQPEQAQNQPQSQALQGPGQDQYQLKWLPASTTTSANLNPPRTYARGRGIYNTQTRPMQSPIPSTSTADAKRPNKIQLLDISSPPQLENNAQSVMQNVQHTNNDPTNNTVELHRFIQIQNPAENQYRKIVFSNTQEQANAKLYPNTMFVNNQQGHTFLLQQVPQMGQNVLYLQNQDQSGSIQKFVAHPGAPSFAPQYSNFDNMMMPINATQTWPNNQTNQQCNMPILWSDMQLNATAFNQSCNTPVVNNVYTQTQQPIGMERMVVHKSAGQAGSKDQPKRLTNVPEMQMCCVSRDVGQAAQTNVPEQKPIAIMPTFDFKNVINRNFQYVIQSYPNDAINKSMNTPTVLRDDAVDATTLMNACKVIREARETNKLIRDETVATTPVMVSKNIVEASIYDESNKSIKEDEPDAPKNAPKEASPCDESNISNKDETITKMQVNEENTSNSGDVLQRNNSEADKEPRQVAAVKGYNTVKVLNHVIDGFLIQESVAPFNIEEKGTGVKDNVVLEDQVVKPTLKTVSDVYELVNSLEGCAKYAELFLEQEIDGDSVFLLKCEDMVKFLKIPLGKALIIKHNIDKYRPSVN